MLAFFSCKDFVFPLTVTSLGLLRSFEKSGVSVEELKMDLALLDDVIRRLLEVKNLKPGKNAQLSESEIKQLCAAAKEIFLSRASSPVPLVRAFTRVRSPARRRSLECWPQRARRLLPLRCRFAVGDSRGRVFVFSAAEG